MASLLNRNGTYYATFSDSDRLPRQRRHSLKTRHKRTAERLLIRLQDAHDLGQWDAWTGTPDDVLTPDRVEDPKRVGEAVALYLGHVEEAFSPTTRRTRRTLMARFVAHVGKDTYVERVTAAQVETFVKANGAALSTQNARLIGLKSFCSFCQRRRS